MWLPSEQSSRGATLTDKIGQSHPVVGAAHKMKTGHCAQHRFQLRHAFQMADGILRQ